MSKIALAHWATSLTLAASSVFGLMYPEARTLTWSAVQMALGTATMIATWLNWQKTYSRRDRPIALLARLLDWFDDRVWGHRWHPLCCWIFDHYPDDE